MGSMTDAILLDTSILVRLANAADNQHSVAANAVLELHRQGRSLHLTSQVLIEFRSVATRPVNVNGLGLSLIDVDSLAKLFESRFSILPETPDIFNAWKVLVSSLGVVGKQVHDARLIAVCQVHGIRKLLTFNVNHFARLGAAAPGVIIIGATSF